MLNMNSILEVTPVEDACKPLPRFGLGACLHVPQAVAPLASSGVVAFLRPSNARPAPSAGFGLHSGLTVSGRRTSVAASGSAAASGIAASDKQSAYNTTLTIADGAGDLGPHPAREPV